MKPLVFFAGLHDGTDEWLRARLDGAEVRSVDSRDSALFELRRTKPALLIVAESLADGEGEELVEEVRADAMLADTPIIFCFGRNPAASLPWRLVHSHRVDRLMVDPPRRAALVDNVADLLGIDSISRDPGAGAGGKLAAGVAALWERFREQIFLRVDALEQAGHAMLEGTLDEDGRRAAEREAHKLAGSVGTFGFTEGSATAREVELLLSGSSALDPDSIRRFNDLIRQLRTQLEGNDAQGRAGAGSDRGTETLLIVDVDADFGERIEAVAATHGVTGRLIGSSEVLGRLNEIRPELVIIDASSDAHWTTRTELLHQLVTAASPIPILVLGDEESRIRRSALADRHDTVFIRKPVSAEEVFARGQQMLGNLQTERGRIVAVDDDPQVLAVVRTILRREGFDVTDIGDPLRLFQELESEPPDLLILDLDMPYLSGIELCGLVRGHPSWQGVPIVLLTAHREADVVQRVFAAGADDFVLKPLVGPELVTRVANRLERSRLYRAMAETDSLTGVANRRKSTDQFHQLNRLANRNDRPLSFAILDLDRFKMVNDRYGHGLGDRVLREFANFLLRTFREEDVVGRWGGEEFVLGLYGMTREQGIRRLGRAIEEFRQTPFDDGIGGVLHITFSAGIAEYPRDGLDLQSLYLAADRALYGAKASGRARVQGVTPADREAAKRLAATLVPKCDGVF
jgi:diguanylate cyclase (GGDEF)-like protein